MRVLSFGELEGIAEGVSDPGPRTPEGTDHGHGHGGGVAVLAVGVACGGAGGVAVWRYMCAAGLLALCLTATGGAWV